MKFEELNDAVVQWADDKGILDKATVFDQLDKTVEELDEAVNAAGGMIVLRDDESLGVMDMEGLPYSEPEFMDEMGDVLVTMIIAAELKNVNLTECLNIAYTKISKRTGKMVNGQFVRDK